MKKSASLSIYLSFIIFFTMSSSFAEQLHYSKIKIDDSYQLTYQWLDAMGIEQNLSFTLPKEALFSRFRNFRSYRPDLAEKEILRAMKIAWFKDPIDGVSIKFPTNNQQQISITAKNQKDTQTTYEKLNKLEQQCRATYLKDNHYQIFTTHDQVTAIKPNHVAIANTSVPDLKSVKPIILETVSIKNIRKVTDYVLSFIQSIPYSPLESRVSSSGAGFNPPLKVLWENQGDCDSKVTLTAALLRALMPRIPMRLIFIEQHAFIGISIPKEEGDVSITEGGQTFVLAEPTGPSLLPLGTLSEESEQAIYNGHYITEAF